MSHLNKYSSIVPSEMTNKERRHMVTELTIANNWKQTHANVQVGENVVRVPVTDINDYREAYSPVTGQLIR